MTVINWERIGKAAGKGFLFFLEYCIKLSAFVVTGVVLATNGSFGTKLGTGFASISPTLRGFFETTGEISGLATKIHDFNNMSSNAFNAKHGLNAVNDVFSFLDGGIVYFQTIMSNFSNQPLSTFFAALLSFGSLFIISLVLRFARQKGQGSHFNRLERKLSERIYSGSKKLTKPVSETKPATSSSLSSGSGRSSRSKSKSGSRSGFRSRLNSGAKSSSNTNSISASGPGIKTQTNRNAVAGSGQGKSTVNKKAQSSQSPNSFKKAKKTNKHLENYVRSVQNGGG